LYLVMEYVPGLSLYHFINDRGPMSETTTLCVGHELALALEHAHAHQVVHRDIKPENILLTNGRVVLTDFGVVKAIAANNALGIHTVHTKTQVLGTPGFMAPEQFSGKNIDARADIFALGAVLYNLATGHLPFEANSIDELLKRLRKGRFTDPRDYNPLLSAGLCDLLAGCLAHRLNDRIAAARDVRERILVLLTKTGVTEIRHELVEYEASPARSSIDQRERSLDALVRDLKVAIKDRDEDAAQALVERIKLLAPTDDRMLDISGVSVDSQARPVVVGQLHSRERWSWLAVGVLAGAVLGGVLSAFLVVNRLLPDSWLGNLLYVGRILLGD